MQVVQNQPVRDKMSENIVVVKTRELDAFLKSQGLWTLNSGVIEISERMVMQFVSASRSTLVRRQAEQDDAYRQIIPYVTILRGNEVFVTKRSKKTTEGRLKNLYSLGIGGHLNEADFSSIHSIFDLANREVHEEVSIDLGVTKEAYKKQFKGLIVDNSNLVGMVHIGLWMCFSVSAKVNVTVKSELAQGFFLKRDEFEQILPELEPWSRLLLSKI